MSNVEFTFEQFVKKMELYIAASKAFMQLGSGALALSVLFVEKVVSSSFSILSIWLVLFWLAMGSTVIFSALYQYAAVKLIEYRYKIGFVINNNMPNFLVCNPGIIFGIILVSFISGVIFFVIFAVKSLNV